jgi:glycosyltransferase involved in cell wall biosynthesis
MSSPAQGDASLGIWLPAVRAGSGADVFVERLAAGLERAGHKPYLQWLNHKYELMPWRLADIPQPAGTDIVHASSWQGFAFKRLGKPLVVTEHHYVLDPAFRPFKSVWQAAYHSTLIDWCMQRSFRAADVITTDSQFTARVLANMARVPHAKVIPLWTDYNTFSPDSLEWPGRKGEVFRLLFVGNASIRKGGDVILPLATSLGPAFEIRCTAGLRANKRHSNAENVVSLGRLSLPGLVDEYRKCDAVLVPSRYEGFGYAALEAMACGKAVIGFRCGALDEVVVDGETALMSEIDDLDMLVENCRRLAGDRELLSRLGREGRHRAVVVFDEQEAVNRYISLYRALCRNSPND